ncbi:MAG: YfhO family protein, partial [Armatimonadetes bacterium]|nr:YfhO family protein [Armatimonadota bacterium]
HRLTSVTHIWHSKPSGEITLCECSDALPRAYVTDRVRASTADGALEAVASGGDPRRGTLVEGVSVGLPPTNGFLHPATLVSCRPHRVVVSARAERPCWLVLTDTYYPGWRVSVNGRPASVSVANYAFRGVRIPSGESSVTLVYEPASYRGGLFVGLLTITGVFALLTTEMLGRARHS